MWTDPLRSLSLSRVSALGHRQSQSANNLFCRECCKERQRRNTGFHGDPQIPALRARLCCLKPGFPSRPSRAAWSPMVAPQVRLWTLSSLPRSEASEPTQGPSSHVSTKVHGPTAPGH